MRRVSIDLLCSPTSVPLSLKRIIDRRKFGVRLMSESSLVEFFGRSTLFLEAMSSSRRKKINRELFGADALLPAIG